MARQEQALARVSFVKEVRESRPEETQAALLAWRLARWLVGAAVLLLLLLGAVYVVMTEVLQVAAMTGE